jgi:hypothetical protein
MAGMTVRRATKRWWTQQRLRDAVRRCYFAVSAAVFPLVSARRGSPKSEQLHGFERQRESEFGARTANVAKALWL